MAEEALLKVEEQLNCSICLDTYTDPKLLQCFHVYCQKCLVKLVIRDQQGQLNLTCPTCRQITPIPPRGVAGLPSAFQVNKLLEIVDEHKKVRDEVAGRGSKSTEVIASSAVLSQRAAVQFCSEHNKKELELYCETCEDFICFHCIIKGGKHHSHDYELLDKAFEKYKDAISKSLEPLEKQLTVVSEALGQLEACCEEVSDKEASIEADIHTSIRQLHETLDVRKTELIGQLHQMTQMKLKHLAAQRDQLETAQAQLSSCLCLVKESLKDGSEGEVLGIKTGIARQVKKLTTAFELDLLKPCVEADTIFLPSDITTLLENYGSISTSAAKAQDSINRAKHSEIVLNQSQLPQSQSFSKSMSVEEPRNSRSIGSAYLPASQGVMAAPLQARSNPAGSSVAPGTTTSHLTGPRAVGPRQQVQVTGRSQVGQLPVVMTPFSSLAAVGRSQPELSLGVSGSKSIKVSQVATISVEQPFDVAILSSSGEVVVTQLNRKCITFFSTGGRKIQSCLATEQMFSPRLAICGHRILVTHCEVNHILELPVTGGHIREITRDYGALKLVEPKGIAFNASSKMIYIADGSHRVIVLNSDLSFSSTFGRLGSGVGQFNFPLGVACDDSTGNVYVTDSRNHRIQVFTGEGKFLRMFGRFGGGYGQLNVPSGIVVDPSNGRLYVGECDNRRVSVFSTDGLFLGWFDGTGFGNRDRGFEIPCGLALGRDGTLWVCDCYNDRVLAFKIDFPQ